MHEKKTNLIVAADVGTAAQVLVLADKVGPEICALKIHADIIEDFSMQMIEELRSLAEKHRFLIIEDRKFADIGSTVQRQYISGVHRIVEWADLVTMHPIAGPASVKALKDAAQDYERGVLLIAELSSEGQLIDDTYMKRVKEIAEQYPTFVSGFIAQQSCTEDPNFIILTPGISLVATVDLLGQQYRTPEQAIASGSDGIIVGRAICRAADPQKIAREYRQRAWRAYKDICAATAG